MGGSAFPSVETLERATGLSRRAVQTHLAILVEKGWLKRTKRRNEDGRQGSYLYESKVPRGAPTAPLDELRGASDDNRGVHLTTFRGAPAAPEFAIKAPVEDVSTRDDEKSLDPLRGFDVFWSTYPKRNGRLIGRGPCEKRWRKLSLDNRRAAYRGAKNYAADVAAGLTIAKDPDRWLRDKLWTDWQDATISQPLTLNSQEVPYDPDREAG
jgi:DNA-binding transcriptional ArsR family regulator